MDKRIYREYVAILKEELQPAMGCTEPIAVAYCAALARQTLGALPEISPDNAVALLTYSYNDRTIGTAYLLAKDGIIIDGDDSAAEATTTAFDTANAEASLATASNAEKPQRPHKHISVAGVLITILIVLLILSVIGLISWFIYSKKKEAKALAERRERRRQRLQRSGDEEEFERLLAEYKNKKK